MILSCNNKKAIFRTVVDEGASTCIISMSCWKAIGSLEVVSSPTLLTAFDGHSHRPHGILLAFLFCVGYKVVNVEVEIVVNFDYNILLGHNWVYAMDGIV